MDFNKIPRWALVLIATFGIGACGVLVSTARADLDKFKSIAYQAKNVSDKNSDDIADLKLTTNKILENQETNRREYREDQKELDAKLQGLLIAVNKNR